MVRRLTEMQPGESGRGAGMGGDGDAMRRLMDLGLLRGTTIQVVRTAPMGDPIEVKLRGFMLTLRRTEAEHITVE
ncbi:MAG TPA: FeoA family protein [Longimicrobiaceae bacterium]|nr:FeoA family protein [Longimicrobiaceae bacterium]